MELIITAGLPGTGKTTTAKRIAKEKRAVLLRTDVIRREIFPNPKPPYQKKDMERAYKEMLGRAGIILASGKSVVLDATFAERKHRTIAKKIAKKAGAVFSIIETISPPSLVKKRLSERNRDESQAKWKHYKLVRKGFQKITEPHVTIDTSKNETAKLKVGLDFDGVIVDHTDHKVRAVKDLFGISINENQTQSEALKRMLSEKNYKMVKNIVYGKITLKAKPVKFALSAIKRLKKEGFSLSIVSRRNNPAIPLAWLKDHSLLSIIPKNKIFFAKNENGKAEIIKKLKLDVFLDDKTLVLKKIKFVRNRVLFNYHKIKLDGDWIEVNSWKEFLELVRKIKRAG